VRPDIVFTRRRVAVFVDGCFWHLCPVHGHMPETRAGFWSQKLARNARRDRENEAALLADGWQVLRIWEHEPLTSAVEAITRHLG
jgi:DNA mismatch endonuclease (patch repair protein)